MRKKIISDFTKKPLALIIVLAMIFTFVPMVPNSPAINVTEKAEASTDYLCFTAQESGATVALNKNQSPADINLEYSKDGNNWYDYEPGTTGAITLSAIGDKVYFKAGTTNSSFSKKYDNNTEVYNSNNYQFIITKKVAASGNVMSLLDSSCSISDISADTFDYCFSHLFYNCKTLTSAPKLPAAKLGKASYWAMFEGCTSLKIAPEIQADTLGWACCESMFSGCTSLTQAPTLPATSLAKNCYQLMFQGCTALTQAPTLPATTLDNANYCYFSMFSGCTSLTQAPALPATSLADNCYRLMFQGCTALTQAPQLQATSLYWGCYYGMFKDCTSLTQAPALQATALADSCYNYMFSGCTSLTQAPALPATTLAESCYYYMFSGCTSLTQASTLPATTLANAKYCYYGMFKDCTSLTQAPDLPATTLANYCYYGMFSGCTSLTKASALPATTMAKSCYSYMFSGCTSLTQVPALPATTLADSCYYDMFYGTQIIPDCSKIDFTDKNVIQSGALKGLFGGTKITDTILDGILKANKTSITNYSLPVQDLGNSCYYCMFHDCALLETAPALPATTLANYCYYGMFYGCTSLTQAPALPATTLADNCYYDMFYGTPIIPDCSQIDFTDKNVIQSGALKGLFGGTKITDTILDGILKANKTSITNYSLPVQSLGKYCYYYMFHDCALLETAPALPATTLADHCYDDMFYGCTSLTQAPALPATTLAVQCYGGMFNGCTSLTQAPALPATTLANYCYYGMFSGCTSLTQAPALPDATLCNGCYEYMFYNCSSLDVSTSGSGTPQLTVASDIVAPSNYMYEMFTGTHGGIETPEKGCSYYLTPYHSQSTFYIPIKYVYADDGTFMSEMDVYKYNKELHQKEVASIQEAAKDWDTQCRTKVTKKGIRTYCYLNGLATEELQSFIDKGYTLTYDWYRADGKGKKFKYVDSTDKNSFLDKSVKKGKYYEYKVKINLWDEDGNIYKSTLADCAKGFRTF